MNRFYALSYKIRSHLFDSLQHRVVGVHFSVPGYFAPFRTLGPGDVVLLRDRTQPNQLTFFRHAVVVSPPYQAQPDELVWSVERKAGRVLWADRVRVDFDAVAPLPGLYASTWRDWIGLGWRRTNGAPHNRQSLSVILHGRFLPPGHSRQADCESASYRRFLALLRGRRVPESMGFDLGEEATPFDGKEVGDAGELHVYKFLKRGYPPPEYSVEWVSQANARSPFDLRVCKNGRPMWYVEVKSTTRARDAAVAYISSGELAVRTQDRAKHKLFLVTFAGSIKDRSPAIYEVPNGFSLEAVKWRMDIPLHGTKRIQ